MTRFNTQLVHGLPVNDNNTGAVNPPIYNSSTYAVESVNAMPRWDYARSGNPTREYQEKQIAQLEHGSIDNPRMEQLTEELAERLLTVKGRKVYGYLPPRTIAIVDAIVEEIAKEAGSVRAANIVMLGAATPLIGIEYDKIEAGIRQIFGRKGEDIVNMNLKALKAGYDLAQSLR